MNKEVCYRTAVGTTSEVLWGIYSKVQNEQQQLEEA
jgi:hypothetical protein